MSLDRLISFVDLLNELNKVERTVYIRGTDRHENDVEHSYQLTMCTWYLAQKFDLGLDVNKIIKYSLVHDIVEAYAGDTSVFDKKYDQKWVDSKKDRERRALEQIGKEFTDFVEMTHFIESYEVQADREAIFVHTLDKILPVLNSYLDGGKTWSENGVTPEFLEKWKNDIIARVPKLNEIWKELMIEVRSNPSLFTKKINHV